MYADRFWLSRNAEDRAAELAAEIAALETRYTAVEAEIARLDALCDRSVWDQMDAREIQLARIEAEIAVRRTEADDLAFSRWAASHRGLFARGPQS
jgi:Tfp pilus assembly protein PilV